MSEGGRIDQTGWRRILGLVQRRGHHRADAEDLVQEAYAKLLEERTLDRVRDVGAYLAQTTRNLAIDEERKRVVRRRAHADRAVSDLLAPQPSCQHEVIAARERLRTVKAALADLPPAARTVFLAHRVDGRSYSEIARDLEISVSAVEKNMARALTHLSLRLHEMRRRRGRD